MSDSWAEAMEMLAFRLHVYDDLYDRTSVATTGWVDIVSAAKADVNSDFAASMNAGLEADREAAAVILAQGNIELGVSPYMEDIAQQTKSTAGSAAAQFRDLFDYMHTNSLLVNSRDFVMGTPAAAGGNVGDGEIIRLVIDDRGYTMEGWQADSFVAECTEDSNQLGIEFEETFLITGQNASIDNLKRSGSGLEETISCFSERDSESFVQNPSFENYGGTTPTAGSPQTPTSLAGWTPASGAAVFTNIQVQVDQLWRSPPGSSTSISVEFTDNESISQHLVDVNGTEIDQDTPFAIGIALYRKSSCDGNFIISFGSVSRNVALTGQGNNAWAWIWLRSTPDRYS